MRSFLNGLSGVLLLLGTTAITAAASRPEVPRGWLAAGIAAAAVGFVVFLANEGSRLAGRRRGLALDIQHADVMGVDQLPKQLWPAGAHVVRIRDVRITNQSSNAMSLQIMLCVQSEGNPEFCPTSGELRRRTRGIASLWEDKPVQDKPAWLSELPSWITNAVEEPIDIGPQQSKTLDLAFFWDDGIYPAIDFRKPNAGWLIGWSNSSHALVARDFVSGGRRRYPFMADSGLATGP
jgi:hypothetical protein